MTSCPRLVVRLYAEIIDGAGTVVARAEEDVAQDGDLTVLVQLALDRFQERHPDQSLMTKIGQAGLTVRFGKAELPRRNPTTALRLLDPRG